MSGKKGKKQKPIVVNTNKLKATMPSKEEVMAGLRDELIKEMRAKEGMVDFTQKFSPLEVSPDSFSAVEQVKAGNMSNIGTPSNIQKILSPTTPGTKMTTNPEEDLKKALETRALIPNAQEIALKLATMRRENPKKDTSWMNNLRGDTSSHLLNAGLGLLGQYNDKQSIYNALAQTNEDFDPKTMTAKKTHSPAEIKRALAELQLVEERINNLKADTAKKNREANEPPKQSLDDKLAEIARIAYGVSGTDGKPPVKNSPVRMNIGTSR